MQTEAEPRTALVIAHPGHELRVLAWVRRVRPRAFPLTDGSGTTDSPRLDESVALLESAGATLAPAAVPALPERAYYRALLDGDIGFFLTVAEQLRAAFAHDGIERAAGDALEYFNTIHDLCRYLLDAVCLRLQRSGQTVENLAFLLEERPDRVPAEGQVHVALSAEELAWKRAAATGYEALRGEVERALAEHGEAAFHHEFLCRCTAPSFLAQPEAEPYYEKRGREQVARGRYSTVITFRQHLAPVARALADWARG